MKIESHDNHGIKYLDLIPESEQESLLIDTFLGKPGTNCNAKILLGNNHHISIINWTAMQYLIEPDADEYRGFHLLNTSPCIDCSRKSMAGFMVTDEVWHEAGFHGFNDGVICLECIQKRLKRPLTIPDIHDCLLSAWLIKLIYRSRYVTNS